MGRCSLTEAALGGKALPVSVTIQPLGSPAYVVIGVTTVSSVVEVSGIQGYTLGGTNLEVGLCGLPSDVWESLGGFGAGGADPGVP